ncbi:1,2-phenylacetyl-CoA epoxidase subunit PaaA [Effusibacillus lacus]|uniref:Phenylacetate-CoA oxygenase subunit PaaA n=1 Tax=Effusibacillus lacus TaxID=1348429 RepID=A0A292YLD0_9BACL|nr:1,2-phenylacetyl-CoA epoxidase subunit PaaA [Effusibacillus lacus]TCS72802.1 ring-1,2-phenylacetyl-CoA epoxidase subunit PaaA [Effusibacillus lacus]GAX89270.1 phenylacetate-CoA oxygenase subunit PaaA [Effusibacillus lacus]
MSNQVVLEKDQESEKLQQFLERIERGEKIEADDWMPDDYRKQLIKLIAMHGISEIMGALPEKEWVPKAPTLHRKLAIMAKVQDEMGHGQLLLRVAEDLAAPLGKTREDFINDLFNGDLKFHNVFHMPAPEWSDAGVIGWLVDGAAIVTQTMLLETSYAPYQRVLQRITAEEKFHMQHGESIVLALAEGTKEQRRMLQDALTRWWPSLVMFFGPPEDKMASNQNINLKYKIRTKTNEELRQIFFSKYIPHIWHIGLTIPDETLRYDEAEGRWVYQQPDWNELKRIIRGQGPKTQERLKLRKVSYDDNKWVRDALLHNQRTAG